MARAAGSVELAFHGQLSSYVSIWKHGKIFVAWGGRYLPRLGAGQDLSQIKLDAEVSADIWGSFQTNPGQEISPHKRIELYRGWVRLRTATSEHRLGRQQINFGPGVVLRPLKWFGGVDPWDPLKASSGQWGLLSKFHFQGNRSLWLWGLYGNRGLREWEQEETSGRCPEFGGRLEWSLTRGEMGFSTHRRLVRSHPSAVLKSEFRLGLDGKWDLGPGMWYEACWLGRRPATDSLVHRRIIALGIDYTLKNGIYLLAEHLSFSDGQRLTELNDPRQASAFSVSYNIGLLDQVKFIGCYDWKGRSPFLFFNWKRIWVKVAFHLLAFWSDDDGGSSGNAYEYTSGRGLGLMAVYEH